MDHLTYIPKEAMQTTAFGELNVESKTPQVQINFPYGIVHPDVAEIYTNKSGSTHSVANGQCTLTCSATAESFVQLRTLEAIRYGPGQGAEWLGTAVFSTGVANSVQLIGAGDSDEGFFFGYNGEDFGICRKSGGSSEIRSLAITGAATGTGNITITLDGAAILVAVTNLDTIAAITAKIVAQSALFFNASKGYKVHTDDNISVEFLSLRAEPATGTFSFSAGTTGVTAGAFSTSVTGIVPTSTWVLKPDWNVDPLDGTGPSGSTMTTTFGNVFKIQFQYLGYGAVECYRETPSTGIFQLVHRIAYANTATTPTLTNPTLQLTAIIYTEAGYTGPSLTLSTGSMAGFIQGQETIKGIRRSLDVEKTATSSEAVLLVLHNELDFNGKINKVSIYPDFTSFATDGTKAIKLRLYKNPTTVVAAAALTDVDTGVSVMQYSSTGTTIVGGKRLLTFIIGAAGGGGRALNDLLVLFPGDRLVLTQEASGGGAGITSVSYTWLERI